MNPLSERAQSMRHSGGAVRKMHMLYQSHLSRPCSHAMPPPPPCHPHAALEHTAIARPCQRAVRSPGPAMTMRVAAS